MNRIGFDTSSLNQFGRIAGIDAMCADLARKDCAPILSSLTVLEIFQWGDERARDDLLAAVAKLRRVADFRLLPSPDEVVQREFDAWLKDRPSIVFGGEQISELMQAVLEHVDARAPGWRREVETHIRGKQKHWVDRVKGLRSSIGGLDAIERQGTAEDLIKQCLGSPEAMAKILNAWFPASVHGQSELTPDEAARCFQHLTSVRAYFVSVALAGFKQGIQGQSTRRGAVGAFDIAQAAYLPFTDGFVVDDREMRGLMRDVVRIVPLPTTVMSYEELRSSLGSAHDSR